VVTKTYPWDPAESMDSPEEQAAYLRITIEQGDANHIAHALGVVARARGMTEIAKKAGIGRESLYKALREEGNPEMGTVMKVLAALGVQLTTKPMSAAVPEAKPTKTPAKRSGRVAKRMDAA